MLKSYINQTAKVKPYIEIIFHVTIFLLMISTAQLSNKASTEERNISSNKESDEENIRNSFICRPRKKSKVYRYRARHSKIKTTSRTSPHW